MSNRYALYFWPEPGGTLAELARRWTAALPAAWTAGARVYGLHATLKAPFRLAPGRDLDGLRRAVADLAGRLAPVARHDLVLTRLDGFLALCPPAPHPALSELAQACVAGLDDWRAPLSEADMAKRLKKPLSARQRHLLDQWGYPLTEEQFRFHITLTDRLDHDDAARAEAALAPLVADAVAEGLTIDAVWLVEQRPGGDFTALERFPLGASCGS